MYDYYVKKNLLSHAKEGIDINICVQVSHKNAIYQLMQKVRTEGFLLTKSLQE